MRDDEAAVMEKLAGFSLPVCVVIHEGKMTCEILIDRSIEFYPAIKEAWLALNVSDETVIRCRWTRNYREGIQYVTARYPDITEKLKELYPWRTF